jgi:tetratricopeptide (TPR) repeat protein
MSELARELQHDLAESIFSEVLETNDVDELVRAKANNSMALSITSGRANINDAFPYLITSVEILRKSKNWYWLGQVLYNLSYVSRLAGRREDARRYGEEALQVLDEYSQLDNVTWLVKKSRILSELGLVLWLLGEPEQARARFNEALKIQLSIGAKDPAIETYANLGRLERTTGNWDESIRQLENGIKLAVETENQHQMAWTKNALGNVYVELEDWPALSCRKPTPLGKYRPSA